METQRIEYLRKNGRKKGRKKGVLFCGIDPDDANKVMLGFTLCSNLDRFDYIDDRPVKGFGLETAKKRAIKWKNHEDYFVQNSFTERMFARGDDLGFLVNPDIAKVVELPPSIMKRLKVFIERCKKYYKDKEFPKWVNNIEIDNPIPSELIKVEVYSFEECC